MTVKAGNSGGRTRLNLSVPQRDELRRAADRARKAASPESKAEAERLIQSMRALERLRTEIMEGYPDLVAAREDARLRQEAFAVYGYALCFWTAVWHAIEEGFLSWPNEVGLEKPDGFDDRHIVRRKRRSIASACRAIDRQNEALAKRVNQRWLAVTATGEYSRALDGTEELPEVILTAQRLRARPTVGQSPQPRPHLDDSRRYLHIRKWKRKLAHAFRLLFRNAAESDFELLRGAYRNWRTEERRVRTHALKFVVDGRREFDVMVAEQMRQRWFHRRARQREPVWYEQVGDGRSIASWQEHSFNQRSRITPEQRAELERRRDLARATLPPPISPLDAYRLLRLDEVAFRPRPEQELTREWASEAEGLRVRAGATKVPADHALRKESLQPTGVEAKHGKVPHYRLSLPTNPGGPSKWRKVSGETPAGPKPTPLHILAQQAWREYAPIWKERNKEVKESDDSDDDAHSRQDEIDEAA